ncbi:MAG TPA: MogA/MoaB family molybdenum cofactor biosynthesis protein, partial [candidate division Zixibacteria bacterium]|nr:MogA/MoaB family molybdenum cofactor biosynthesis protein [candidate division Zixibacteria bacterium]
MPYSVGIIIISDRASRGEREDGCLPVFKQTLDSRFEIVESVIVSDDPKNIETALQRFIAKGYNLIFTSGGTGCAARDNTPEVTQKIIERFTPGVDEAIRAFSTTKSTYAIYSRAVSGIAENSFIVNLPGSPKAVKEIVEFLLSTIE